MRTRDIRMRDPFVLALREEGKYALFGTTDPDCWNGTGIGFDAYLGRDLEEWEGPIAAFRPEAGFWATKNFWAPEAHAYGGRYYLFASFKSEGAPRATQALVADSPLGPYRAHSPRPLTPEGWECLDGTLHVDAEGAPWLVFCHEWVQVRDGEIRAIRLTPDLRESFGTPALLFKGSEAPWTAPHPRRDGSIDRAMRVTDGPFLHRTASGALLLLWSSFSGKGYAMGVAASASGTVLGPWLQGKEPLVDADSGHGMVFSRLEGGLAGTWHTPNATGLERPVFFEVEERGEALALGRPIRD